MAHDFECATANRPTPMTTAGTESTECLWSVLATRTAAPSIGAASAGVLALLFAAGCAGSPRTASSERRADTEVDVATDLFAKGRTREALDHVQQAVALDDENGKALYLGSAIYMSFCAGPLGDESPDCHPEKAEEFARRAVKADGNYRDAKNLLGQALINRGKFGEAIDVLAPLTRDPAYASSHLAWANLGWAQVKAGKLDEGILSLQNSVVEPRFCVGFYRLGEAYRTKKDAKRAEQAFTSALSVDSLECQGLVDAWRGRAEARRDLGRIDDAKSDFQRCEEIGRETKTGAACAQARKSLGAVAP